MNKKKVLIIVAVVIVIALAIFFFIKQKKKRVNLVVYGEGGSPIPPADAPAQITSGENQSQGVSIQYEECDGLMGWWDCFPLKKGLKDGDGFTGSKWITQLQTYLGITADGYFGNNTEKAVIDAIGEKTVDWWQYRNIKDAYCRLNPNNPDCVGSNENVTITETK